MNWASDPTVILTTPPKPLVGCLATVSPNWCSTKELFCASNTRNWGVASMFLLAYEYPASRYPLTLMPEASSTCESVGALAAWASASVGAANAAETADAMRSFFIERPFVGGKNTSAVSCFGLKPARLLNCRDASGFRPKRPPPTCLIPTNVYLVSLVLHSSRDVKNYRGCNPASRRKDRPKKDFFQLPYYPGAHWAERGAVMMDAIGLSGRRVSTSRRTNSNVNLHVSTYNIHKGFSQFNRRMMIRELRDHLQLLGADIIFLQEVQGVHRRHAARFEDWPEEPQYEFLADQVWPDFAYGRNAVYDHGHHGNAILSRYPIVRAENEDVSHHALERRGMLHCEIELPEGSQRLHCICVHLALHERGRRHQVGAIIERLHREVPEGAPIVVAGDFNDWRNRAGK